MKCGFAVVVFLCAYCANACLHSDLILDNILRGYNTSIRPNHGRSQETLWVRADFQRLYQSTDGVVGGQIQLKTQWSDHRLVFSSPRLQPCSTSTLVPEKKVWQPSMVVSCTSGAAGIPATSSNAPLRSTVLTGNGVLTQVLHVDAHCPLDKPAVDWRYPFGRVSVTWRVLALGVDSSAAILVWERDRPPAVTAADYRLPERDDRRAARQRLHRSRRQDIANPLTRQAANTTTNVQRVENVHTSIEIEKERQRVSPSFSDIEMKRHTDMGLFYLRKFGWDYSLSRIAGADVSELYVTAILAVRRAPYILFRFAPVAAATLIAGLASLWPMRREMAVVRALVCLGAGLVLLVTSVAHSAELPASVVFTLFHAFVLGSAVFLLVAVAAALLERRADKSNTLKHSGYDGNERDNIVTMYESIVFRRFCCAARYRLTFVLVYTFVYIAFIIVFALCCSILVDG